MTTLIDTNAYSALMKGNEQVASFLDHADVVYLSVIVAAELLAGFKGSKKERENKILLSEFIEKGGKTVVLPIVYETSHRFAQIKDALKKKGTPIPLNDIWIAAQCMEKGTVLLSFDGHFEAVDGLLLWNLPG
jgi:tRNA(fMet)-specific endonuclease VapC